MARNAPIQGTAADIIKIAMVRVHNRLKEEKLDAKLILQIHDELIIDTLLEEQEQVKKLLVEEMESALSLSVTLTVSAGTGRNWFEAK